MAHIKRKYIDSHWLVFIFQGIIALFFGCLTLFTSSESSAALAPVIGIAMLALAVVEFANSLHRSRNRSGWLVATLIALFDAGFGITLLVVANESMTMRLLLVSVYTLLRGIFELVIGFRTTVDPTDRFIWVLCGVCGLVFGVVILNSGHLTNVDFIRFFGAYMMILGVCSLIYGAHNRTQVHEDREARIEAARSTRRSSTKGKSAKKPAKKS